MTSLLQSSLGAGPVCENNEFKHILKNNWRGAGNKNSHDFFASLLRAGSVDQVTGRDAGISHTLVVTQHPHKHIWDGMLGLIERDRERNQLSVISGIHTVNTLLARAPTSSCLHMVRRFLSNTVRWFILTFPSAKAMNLLQQNG
uniref:Uncharacterized protein n=1 Tax=Oncorhynchus tshawytscha TaxID=74940 RepID=A0AAZ3S892_ONCTS